MHTLETSDTFSAEEQAVVQMAAKNRGVFEIANRSDTKGPAVRSGNDKLFDAANSSYAMQCCEAIPRLIELQLVRQAGSPKRFELTNFGWQLSRNLTANSKSEQDQPVQHMQTQPVRAQQQSSLQDQQERCVTQPVRKQTGGEPSIAPADMGVTAPRPAPVEPQPDQPQTTQPRSAQPGQEPPKEEQPVQTVPRAQSPTPPDSSGEAQPREVQPRLDARPKLDSSPRFETPPDFGNATNTDSSLVSALGLDEGFLPHEPETLEETGLSGAAIEDLVLKVVQNAGAMSGREIAEHLCLPLAILEDRFTVLRNRQHLTPTASGMLGDYVYQLTDSGRERARLALKECAYAGPAPVPLEDYVDSVQAQTIRTEKPKRDRLEKAFSDINVEPEMLAQLGPAISAGRGMFIYGPPGNGKTTIAQRITRCFGQNILIPHAIIEDGQVIKLYDAACHEPVEAKISSLLKTNEHDRRWIRIRRPTVVVGGELTMDSLELKHDPVSHISEASLQLKSNCGSLLIDDFGRQRINPTELLNRWIVPLENRIDYLSLANGKKVQVPFEQLIIFSTNLEPHDLADDAFLRRIPFKIEIGAPSRDEFAKLFAMFAGKLKVQCPAESLEYLLTAHYDATGRPLRRCQARDLLDQALHYCEYNELPPVATPEILDHAVHNYFTAMAGTE